MYINWGWDSELWQCGTVLENNLILSTTTYFSPTPQLPITTAPPLPTTTPVSSKAYAISDSGSSYIYLEVGVCALHQWRSTRPQGPCRKHHCSSPNIFRIFPNTFVSPFPWFPYHSRVQAFLNWNWWSVQWKMHCTFHKSHRPSLRTWRLNHLNWFECSIWPTPVEILTASHWWRQHTTNPSQCTKRYPNFLQCLWPAQCWGPCPLIPRCIRLSCQVHLAPGHQIWKQFHLAWTYQYQCHQVLSRLRQDLKRSHDPNFSSASIH